MFNLTFIMDDFKISYSKIQIEYIIDPVVNNVSKNKTIARYLGLTITKKQHFYQIISFILVVVLILLSMVPVSRLFK